MHIVIASDSFKGSLSSGEVARYLGAGLRGGWPQLEVEELPVADGGEGLVTALVGSRADGRLIERRVTGPLGEPVLATFGLLSNAEPLTAVIETAAASGLTLLPAGEFDPMRATTRGTGELIASALELGARRLVIGLGGSATHDGGAGVAQALGARLLDERGEEVGPGAAGLLRLARIDAVRLDRRLDECELIALCDVDNPLCGPEGAAAAFAPQKGATPALIPLLDEALHRWAEIVARAANGNGPGAAATDADASGSAHERDVLALSDVPGAGAAGGLGFGLMAVLGAGLHPGVRWVLEELGARARFAQADLVITGEGRIDASTLHGKLPIGVAALARECGVPVVAVAGAVELTDEQLQTAGIQAALTTVRGPVDLSEAMAHTPELLGEVGRQLARLLRLGMSLRDA